MSECCIECGAVLQEGKTCQEIFDEFLSFEFTDLVYGQVHFLTVSCFMIQHCGYSDEALVWIQSQLRTYLNGLRNIQQIRQMAGQGANPGNRSWKVTRQADAPPLPKVIWSMTIVDVSQSTSDAEQYCKKITQWAQSTLEQMASLLP